MNCKFTTITFSAAITLVASLSIAASAQKAVAPPAQDTPDAASQQPAVPGAPLTLRTKQNAVTGSIAIQAVQGTSGASPIANIDFELLLVHNGKIINTVPATLDEHGVVVMNNIPVAMGVTPVVRINYADVVYQRAGELMDRDNPEQKITITCYEVTDSPPAWSVHMRHVMLAHTPEGVRVTELIILNNPADHTWIGLPAGDDNRLTTSLTIAPDAAHIEYGEGFFGGGSTRLNAGLLQNSLPLTPGSAQMSLSYVVHAQAGVVNLALAAPVPTDNIMLVVPADMTTIKADRFQDGGATRISDTDVRFYTASQINPNEILQITLAGATSQVMTSTGVNQSSRNDPASMFPKVIAGLGGSVILVGAFVFLLLKPSRSTTHEL